MAKPAKRGFWRGARICFRWCRIAVWVCILAVLCGLVYLDDVGLPGFMKRPLVQRLRERGVELQFNRLRLAGYHGIVADDVRFGQAGQAGGPSLTASRAELRLDLHQLLHFHVQVQALVLRHGTFEWVLMETNGPPQSLKVENIETSLNLLSGDRWSLDDFRATFAGAQFTLSANVANASAVRDWEFLHEHRAGTVNWPEQWRHFSDTLKKISFAQKPDIRLMVRGDARDRQSFTAFLTVNALEVSTPWGAAKGLLLATKLTPATTNADMRVNVRLEAVDLTTPWATGRDLEFFGAVSAPPDLPPADSSWAWWTNFQPYCVDWTLKANAPRYVGKIEADSIAAGGSWRAPELVVTNLLVQWPEGTVSAGARLDVSTREAQFQGVSDFDAKRVEPLLTEKAQAWLDRFGWTTAPCISASGSAVLPAWTNRQPDWRAEVVPTVGLAGELTATNGSYMSIPADRVHLHFNYTNMVWQLPDLDVSRPEGRIHLTFTEDDRTRDFHWQVRGVMDPQTIRPLLETNAQHGLDLMGFTTPPMVEGEIWARNYTPELLRGYANLSVSNFTFRGETADYFQSKVEYTNRLLQLVNPQLWRSGQVMTAACVAVDIPTRRIYFTNGFSTTDPQAVARAIGVKTTAALAPYHFLKPPTVHVEGYCTVNDIEDTDMRFAVDGGPFAWWKFKLPAISGNIHWTGSSMLLTNVQASFYKGEGRGWATFDFEPDEGTDFGFKLDVKNADLKSLMNDLSTRTNHLEGWLSGSLVVTSANSADKYKTQGFGGLELRDGLIWDIPMFGILSPALDTIVPGLGTTRASEAKTQFIINNGVITTDKLEIRAPVLRLQYAGKVDLDGNINAKVEAEPFKDMLFLGRMVGMVLSPVTKLFEYRITGTLTNPRSEPIYIPKFLLFPLHPFQTMQDLFSPENGSTEPLPTILPEQK